MDIITQKQDKLEGMSQYFTGMPCCRGHLSIRLTTGGDCYACKRLRRATESSKRVVDAYNKQYRLNHPRKPHTKAALVKQREWNRLYYAENREKELERSKLYQSKQPKGYRGSRAAESALANARRKNRAVAWADQDAIKFFYECCPEGYQVDHIIPLNGNRVSGLHVEENLQWLPTKVNQAKGNRFNLVAHG